MYMEEKNDGRRILVSAFTPGSLSNKSDVIVGSIWSFKCLGKRLLIDTLPDY